MRESTVGSYEEPYAVVLQDRCTNRETLGGSPYISQMVIKT